MSSFPSSGTAAPAGLPNYEVYASPNGSDSAQGSQGSPFRTMYKALQTIIGLGGGTVYYNDNTLAGGPVADQGVWLRNDGIEVPGFLNINGFQIRLVGQGNQSGQFVFERPGAARLIAGSAGDYRKPGIWIVGSEVPIDICYVKSVISQFGGQPTPVRLGWDYARKADFSREELTITNATRSSGSTVFTVDLSSATSWTIQSASRDVDDNVQLVLTRPLTIAMSPWAIGSIIRVTTSDSDFPSIDAVVTNQSDVLTLQGETTITVTYVQSGATTPSQALVGTVKSHGLQAGDYLALTSSSSQFPTCHQMRVTGATVATVTVNDPYGYSPRSASANVNNIGTLVKQVRGRSVASAVSMYRCSLFGYIDTVDNFIAGATLDHGGSSASQPRLYECYISGGLNWPFGANYDPYRTQVSVLCDPGSGTGSGASLIARDCQSQAGHVIFEPHVTEAALDVDRWLQDSAGDAFPTIVCGNGSPFSSIRLDRIANADATVDAISIGANYDRLKVQIGDVFSTKRTPISSQSPFIGPTNIRSASWLDTDDVCTPSPWQLGWNCIWPGGLATKHPGANRALGPVQARFTNIFPKLSDWGSLPAGVTATQDGLGPDGSSTAFKVVTSGAFVAGKVTLGPSPSTLSASVGDWVAFGCWINSAGLTNAANPNLNIADLSGGISFEGQSQLTLVRHILEPGWQWCQTAAQISAIGNGHYELQLNLPILAATYYLFGPTIVVAPASIKPADFYEYFGTLKHQPIYLPPGMSGTMEGTKFCAHDGLATAKYYTVGGGAGQISIAAAAPKAIEVFDEAGNSLGVIRPNAFTVN